MKIYTEEQLKKYIFENGFIEIFDFENDLIPSIELPTDEQLVDLYDELNWFGDTDWILGAKWMRDKIQGGNK